MRWIQPMTGFNRGDVVLVEFVFSDKAGTKRRPALIISSDYYNRGRQEIIIAAITSRVDRILPADCKIDNWKEAGLLFPSVVTGVIRTIKQSAIERVLGTMPIADMQRASDSVRIALDL
ncbi:MAG: type II toxin-antitoxin system PemK/MazF family toxin [Dehalococcoidales bacterium]|nr:type II toxin-antitoxin system PemK/MazF family toxin [Dehalococcoidales bacterium]MDD4323081.1 type II toxin-antitoxin system PemK/MazF family toxin [Dehalococcoidales bacterium]MDD4794439.1 type II toxin-antitoxin system PemK/MazF family toxin [Dehalococcoidales bacterium]MDX9802583.1 type II toxin-antitoxin system PemK/MazF family toxin [Dehalococcoidales bacterium]